MKNISFSLTERQLMDGSKTVTRRLGWKNLKIGERLCAVRKAMGLKRGEKMHRLAIIEVRSVKREFLYRIKDYDHCGLYEVAREGFWGMLTEDFVTMFCKNMKCQPNTEVTRIEFRVVEYLQKTK